MVVASAVWPPLAQPLPKPRAFAERAPPPSPAVGVAFLSEVAVAVDVEEVVRVAVQVVVRVPVVAPWLGIVRVPVEVP